ncbi:MAG: 50S ribosomal protein L22 [Archaeoglobi archaeon]|nr:50S ribosomal protein L22 [Candidatus Mnemosynella sp.]
MGRVDYSVESDPEITARAMGYEMPISFKHAVEICNALRGMKVEEARKLLNDVIELRRPIPFRRHKRKVGHRSELSGWKIGRYPQKAARAILKVLENAVNNAEYKGLDTQRLVIMHIAAKKGRVLRGYIPRAYGRATPHNKVLTTVEIILREV